MDKVILSILGICMAAAVLILIFVIGSCSYFMYQDIRHPCIRSHKAVVFHSAYTQLLPAGKVLIPIYHPACERIEDVCDERKP